jgi:hypothetical protein
MGSKKSNIQKAATGITTLTLFTLKYIRHLISFNSKTVDNYCLQMAEPAKPTFFKRQSCWHVWQNRQHLLSSKSKTVIPTISSDTIFDVCCLQVANCWYLLSSKGNTFDACSLRAARLLTSIVFKWQYCTIFRLMSSYGKAIDTYSLQMAIT